MPFKFNPFTGELDIVSDTSGFVLKAGDTMTGVMTLSAGTAAAPSLNFGDAGTGFYKGGTNIIGIATNGNAAGTISSSGVLNLTNGFTAFTTAGMGANVAGLSLGSGAGIQWSSTTAYNGTRDIGISRLSAGVVGIGTGAVGNSAGTLVAGSIGIGTSPGASLNLASGKHLLIGGTTPPYSDLYNLAITASDAGAAFVIDLPSSDVTGRAFSIAATGEAYGRTLFYSNGFMGIGSGAATRDTFIGRSGTNTLRIGSVYDGSGTGYLKVNTGIGVGVDPTAAAIQVLQATNAAASGIASGNTSALYSFFWTDSSGVARIDGGSSAARNISLNGNGTAGIGIGTASPNANAALDVSSTTKAFMPPRMTTTQKNAISSPTAGMVVYDTTLSKLCVYTTAWETITSA